MKIADNWQDFFSGALVAFLITCSIAIYINYKNERPDDWWCTYLGGAEQTACESMYTKAESIIDHYDNEPNCTPNYMGGCD